MGCPDGARSADCAAAMGAAAEKPRPRTAFAVRGRGSKDTGDYSGILMVMLLNCALQLLANTPM